MQFVRSASFVQLAIVLRQVSTLSTLWQTINEGPSNAAYVPVSLDTIHLKELPRSASTCELPAEVNCSRFGGASEHLVMQPRYYSAGGLPRVILSR